MMHVSLSFQKHLNARLLLVPVMLLNACAAHHVIIEPDFASFPGILELAQQNQRMKVIAIHGMCDHGERIRTEECSGDDCQNAWVKKITERLTGLSGDASNATLLFSEPVEIGDSAAVELWRTEYTPNEIGEATIEINAIVFSSAFREIKRKKLCSDVSKPTAICTEKITYPRKRALVNDFIKNRLMNDCFADAVAYTGSFGAPLRSAIGNVLVKAIIDTYEGAGSSISIVFVSESLGSKIMFDSLAEQYDKSQVARDHLAEALGAARVLYMAANQLPLLDLAYEKPISSESRSVPEAAAESWRETQLGPSQFSDEPPPPGNAPAVSNDSLLGFLRIINDARSRVAPEEAHGFNFQVVAFTDPNDILSYELPAPDGRAFTNVIVKNVPNWFGLFAEPYGAHTKYLNSTCVKTLMRHGVENGAHQCN